MNKQEREKLREGDINALAELLPEGFFWAGALFPDDLKEIISPLLDHIDALEGQAADVIACWGKLYPDADAKKLGITQDELEDMEFGPVNKLRKAIASAPEVKS